MVIVDKGRHGWDLHGVGVVGRVLEEAVVGVEELPWQQEEELPGGAPIVQSLLAVPRHAQLALLQLLLAAGHDAAESVFQEMVSPYIQPGQRIFINNNNSKKHIHIIGSLDWGRNRSHATKELVKLIIKSKILIWVVGEGSEGKWNIPEIFLHA